VPLAATCNGFLCVLVCLQTPVVGGPTNEGGVEGRLPYSYMRVASADDDDDDLAAAGGMLTAVGGATNATAAVLAAATAEAAAAAAADGNQQHRNADANGSQEQERRLVEHLPPANGTEDVYTLLKLYNISSSLVRHAVHGLLRWQQQESCPVDNAQLPHPHHAHGCMP
jgi:hypothetical protein